MSRTATATRDVPQRVARLEQITQLLELGVTDSARIGERLGVHPRTVQRYLREMGGDVDRRVILYPEIKPKVLEHLRTYPHLRITTWMLARALRIPPTAKGRVCNALLSLERDGLVRRELGTRKEGDYSDCVKRILWSITEKGIRDEG